MTPVLRMLVNVLTLLLLLAGCTLIVQNLSTQFTLHLFTERFPNLSVGLMMALTAALFVGSFGVKALENQVRQRVQHQKSLRQLERSEVSAEVSSDKVKALEAKIQTLETALAESLKRSAAATVSSGKGQGNA